VKTVVTIFASFTFTTEIGSVSLIIYLAQCPFNFLNEYQLGANINFLGKAQKEICRKAQR